MYKALIIDDERHARQAILALGNWEEADIDSVLEAAEGQSGLEMMRKYNPDIVFVDIKMPIMNGMDFLENASMEFPNSKYVIISGYGEFEYAKKALKYNVKEYLLKPVVEEELSNILRRVVQELDNERKVETQDPMIYITKTLTAQNITSYKENYYGIVVLHEVSQFRESYTKGSNGKEYVNMKDIIPNTLAEYWDHHSSCLFAGDHAKESLLAVTISKDSAAFSLNDIKIRKYIALQVSNVIKRLKIEYGLYIVAGIGGFTPEIHSLYASYWEALNIINNINLLDSDRNVYIEEEPGSTTRWVSIIDKKELFERAFEKGNMQYARDIIEQYFEAKKKDEYMTMDDLRCIALELVMIFREIAVEKRIPHYKKIIPSMTDKSILKSFKNPKELTNYAVELFNRLYDQGSRVEKFSINDMIEEIKGYIDENYFGEISLQMFSSKYHMTKEYLSKQFKEKYGYGIYEYALKIRMAKAAQMLEESEIKITDLSQRLGYADNNYFSRAFKNYYGVSPKKYRMNKGTVFISKK